MVLSAATALYIGSTSYSKAYIGDTQVWPVQTTVKYKLTEMKGTLVSGYEYVLIYPSGKKMVPNSSLFGSSTLSFNNFNGDGIYDSLPNNYGIFTVYSNRLRVKVGNAFQQVYKNGSKLSLSGTDRATTTTYTIDYGYMVSDESNLGYLRYGSSYSYPYFSSSFDGTYRLYRLEIITS